MPSEIRRNNIFLNSELNDIKLADNALQLFDNTQWSFEVNQMRVNGKFGGYKDHHQKVRIMVMIVNLKGKHIKCFNFRKKVIELISVGLGVKATLIREIT